ncbi:MAG TPA: glycosyltransferase [Verrucomicrobiae bacterium]
MRNTPHISIGIIAWNEEESIEATLDSLFRQSLFSRLAEQCLSVEIICAANGCTDRTVELADAFFKKQQETHPFRHTFTTLTANLTTRGKTNAWNVFVHQLSDRQSFYLMLMDADIVITSPDTLWNMYMTLQKNSEASVSVDQPIKDIAVKGHRDLFSHISLTTSQMTQASSVQLTGQLYCIRAEVARRIYLPRDLIIDDGFIKNLVCTDFLTVPSNPNRVVLAPEAAHIFEAYMSPSAVFRNQKRQMIGQTILHVLVDKELKGLAPQCAPDFATYLKEREQTEPDWLKIAIGEHIRSLTFFWQIFPDAISFRFKRWLRLRPLARIKAFPATCAGFLISLAATWCAYRFLKNGYTSYWPDTRSQGLKTLTLNNNPNPAG